MKELNLFNNDCLFWSNGTKDYILHAMIDEDPESPRNTNKFCEMACFHPTYLLGDQLSDKTPEQWWQNKVREILSDEEIFLAVYNGTLPGIRLARSQSGASGDYYDIYETYYISTVLGDSVPKEYLEYQEVFQPSIVEYLVDDFTIRHCMTLLKDKAVWLPLWLYDHSGLSISCGKRTYPYNDVWDSSAIGWIFCAAPESFSEGDTFDDWKERTVINMHDEIEIYNEYLMGQVYYYELLRLDHDKEDAEYETIDSCGSFYGSDILSNGILDYCCEYGLMEAIENGAYDTGTAEPIHTVTYVYKQK